MTSSRNDVLLLVTLIRHLAEWLKLHTATSVQGRLRGHMQFEEGS
jgi:hypothetical protein